MTVSPKTKVGTHREFSSQEDKTVMPKKKKIKIKAMEFSTVRHQGRTLKMLGDLTPRWRPKTRPKNNLSLNMKRLLNPKLNTKAVTVLDTSSSDEKIEFRKGGCKIKKALKSAVSSDEKIESSKR